MCACMCVWQTHVHVHIKLYRGFLDTAPDLLSSSSIANNSTVSENEGRVPTYTWRDEGAITKWCVWKPPIMCFTYAWVRVWYRLHVYTPQATSRNFGATFRTIIGRRMHAHKTVHFQAVASHLPAAWPLFPLARVKPQVWKQQWPERLSNTLAFHSRQ